MKTKLLQFIIFEHKKKKKKKSLLKKSCSRAVCMGNNKKCFSSQWGKGGEERNSMDVRAPRTTCGGSAGSQLVQRLNNQHYESQPSAMRDIMIHVSFNFNKQ